MSAGTQSAATSAASTGETPRWAQVLQDSPPASGDGGQNNGGGGGGGSSNPLTSIRQQMTSRAGGASPSGSPAPAVPAGTSAEPLQQPENGAVPQETPGGPVQPTPGQPPQQAAPVFQLTQEQMDTMLQRVGQPVQQQQPQQQYTQEQLDEMFQVYKVGAEALKVLGFDNPTPEQVAFFNNLVQGTARQAVAVNSFAMAHQLDQLRAMVGPMQSFFQQQQQQAIVGRFFTKFPNLRGYEPLLEKIRDGWIANGRKFTGEDEAFKAAADEAVSILKSVPGVDVSKLLDGQAVSAAAPAGQQQQPTTQPSGMPTLASGGQGGAGGSPSGGQNTPAWRRVL